MGNRNNKDLDKLIFYRINNAVISNSVAIVVSVIALKSFDIRMRSGCLL
jgi:hypothetical protein